MKVAIVIGSIRFGRHSHKAGYYLEELLKRHNIETEMIDLIDYPLPLLEERSGKLPLLPPKVAEVGKKLKSSDAIVLITPEYHGSFSGVLKNMMDTD